MGKCRIWDLLLMAWGREMLRRKVIWDLMLVQKR